MGNGDSQYLNCARMQDYAQRQDAHGLKTFMNQIGRDALR